MRTNYVYVMRRNDGAHKIGFSKNPFLRSLTLSKPGAPVRLLHTVERPGDAQQVESLTHAFLREKRLDGEWFSVDDTTALAAIRQVIQNHAMDAEIVIQYEKICIRRAVWRVGTEAIERRIKRRLTRAEVTQVEESPEMAAYQQAVADDGLSSKEVETEFQVRSRDVSSWIRLLGLRADPKLTEKEVAARIGIPGRTIRNKLGPRGTPAFGRTSKE